MRTITAALCVTPFLVGSCSLLQPLTPITDGGLTPVDAVVTAVPEIATNYMTGTVYAAIAGAIGLAGTLLGVKGGKHVLKRMKDSEPGKII